VSVLRQLPHNQGRTLHCLAAVFEKLRDKCKQELIRVAELQSDDYHNDRQLYYACRDDREVLCPHIKAGDGRVYRCLYRHKFERKMSEGVSTAALGKKGKDKQSIAVSSCSLDAIETHIFAYGIT